MTDVKENLYEDRASRDISRIELYLMFATDGDFWVSTDGLKSFIDSHLGGDILKFDFRVDKIPLGNWNERQFIRLSVGLPLDIRGIKEGRIPGTLCFHHPDAWADEAMEQVLLPAYMWIFAEIGIGNRHGLSYYFSTDVFDMVGEGGPIYRWPKSEFTDGVRVLPQVETMSGDYGGSWAQFRFMLNDAKDNGGSAKFVSDVVDELDREYANPPAPQVGREGGVQ